MKKNLESRIKNSELQGGFTLIELLIVVVIIGILATLLMTNFVGVRQRGRDAQRKSDLRQIQSALELYRADQGSYPNPALPSCGGSPLAVTGSTYMQKIPCDPSDPIAGNYQYCSVNGTTYTIITCLENTNDQQRDTTTVDPNCIPSCTSTNTSFTLQSP